MNFHPPENMTPFAARLWAAMQARGYTPAKLCKELGVKHSTVSRWLRGSRPAPATLAKLNALFPDSEKPQPGAEAIGTALLECGKALETARHALAHAAKALLEMQAAQRKANNL